MTLVVDASVACKWFLKDEKAISASAILSRILAGAAAEAPTLFELEIQNVLLSAQRAKRIDPGDVDEALDVLHYLPIHVETHGERVTFGNELALARAYSLSCYDAAYLSLALRCRGELVTADKPLARAARDLGIPTTEI